MQTFIYPSYLREPQILGVQLFQGWELPIPPHRDESELFPNIWDEVDYVKSLNDVQLAVYLDIIRTAAFQAGSYYGCPVDEDC